MPRVPPTNLNDAAVRRVYLENLRIAVQQAVSASSLKHARIELREMACLHADQLVCLLEAEVLGSRQEDEKTVVVRYPADWWQALKARWLPAWALRRWPARMAEERVVSRTVRLRCCPHLTVPDHGHRHLAFLAGEETNHALDRA